MDSSGDDSFDEDLSDMPGSITLGLQIQEGLRDVPLFLDQGDRMSVDELEVDNMVVSPHGPVPGFWHFNENDSSSEEDDAMAEEDDLDNNSDLDGWNYQAYDWEGLWQATERLSAVDQLGVEYEKQVNDIGEHLYSKVIIELMVDIYSQASNWTWPCYLLHICLQGIQSYYG